MIDEIKYNQIKKYIVKDIIRTKCKYNIIAINKNNFKKQIQENTNKYNNILEEINNNPEYSNTLDKISEYLELHFEKKNTNILSGGNQKTLPAYIARHFGIKLRQPTTNDTTTKIKNGLINVTNQVTSFIGFNPINNVVDVKPKTNNEYLAELFGVTEGKDNTRYEASQIIQNLPIQSSTKCQDLGIKLNTKDIIKNMIACLYSSIFPFVKNMNSIIFITSCIYIFTKLGFGLTTLIGGGIPLIITFFASQTTLLLLLGSIIGANTWYQLLLCKHEGYDIGWRFFKEFINFVYTIPSIFSFINKTTLQPLLFELSKWLPIPQILKRFIEPSLLDTIMQTIGAASIVGAVFFSYGTMIPLIGGIAGAYAGVGAFSIVIISNIIIYIYDIVTNPFKTITNIGKKTISFFAGGAQMTNIFSDLKHLSDLNQENINVSELITFNEYSGKLQLNTDKIGDYIVLVQLESKTDNIAMILSNKGIVFSINDAIIENENISFIDNKPFSSSLVYSFMNRQSIKKYKPTTNNFLYKFDDDNNIQMYIKNNINGQEVISFHSAVTKYINHDESYKDVLKDSCQKLFGDSSSKLETECNMHFYNILGKSSYSLLLNLDSSLRKDMDVEQLLINADPVIQYEILKNLDWFIVIKESKQQMVNVDKWLELFKEKNIILASKFQIYLDKNLQIKQILDIMVNNINKYPGLLNSKYENLKNKDITVKQKNRKIIH